MIEFIKKTVLTFVLIVVGITVSSSIFLALFYPALHLSAGILGQIVVMSFVCAIGNFIFYAKYEISKQQMMIRKIVHFLYINAIVFLGAFLWHWVTPGMITQFFVLLVMIELVYVAVTVINILKENRDAEVMNQRLSQLNKNDKKDNQ